MKLQTEISRNVKVALEEDLAGKEDITSLIVPKNTKAKAYVIIREDSIICGQKWVDEVFKQIDEDVKISWQYKDGDLVKSNSIIYELIGDARSLLTGERTALNFLQMLSSTATITNKYIQLLKNTKVKLLDSRKTIPGMRLAQKYAVKCGGGSNHRLGLYDAFLIKENHIRACGSIAKSIENARKIDQKKLVEVEVENIEDLCEAIDARADIIMLDNFSLKEMREAVFITKNRAKLEVSGNVNLSNIKGLALTGVDYISVGALTKDIHAIDFSMQFIKYDG